MPLLKDSPLIIWHSDPVGPDETVLLNGYAFGDDCMVKLKRLADDDSAAPSGEVEITPLAATADSLKFVVPASWQAGVYSCVVTRGKAVSTPVLLNAPNVWWRQGDRGVGKASQGGWLSIQGKCLQLGNNPVVTLHAETGAVELKVVDPSPYRVKVEIPVGVTPGQYRVVFSNGSGGAEASVDLDPVEITAKRLPGKAVFNVRDLGADHTGKKDCTLAIVQATELLGAYGGGVVYFPAGRYRIDSVLRSGVFIKSPLKIPQNVTFRGEGTELVSLWWPDQEEPLPALIEGSNNFCIEDLSIYTQGKHSTIIAGESNVTIRRVRIRANHYYMTVNNGKPHHKRGVEVDHMVGPAIEIWGDNATVTDCDIYTSAACFELKHCHGAYLANNTVMARNFFFFSGCSEVIFEHNSFVGNQLTTGGSNFALHMGAIATRHIYMGHNSISHIYGGDHEAFTFDGHQTAYLGKVKNVEGACLELIGDLMPRNFKGAMTEMLGGALFIVEGKGRGQFRWIEDYEGKSITLDSPWLVEPDETSLVSIGGFNGNHLIIGNTMTDTGTAVQLYPPAHECIVAENKSVRASNINCLGRLRQFKNSTGVRVELCWYNQFLDNEIVEGNCWGGGSTEVDRWIGGETCLNIWGWHVSTVFNEFGAGQDTFMTPDGLQTILGESTPRSLSLPMALFTVVRRHHIHNNSSIRIRGRVSETLVENCRINNSARGIRVDAEIDYPQPEDIGQLFDFSPTDPDKSRILDFLAPDQLLIRNNHFNGVEQEYLGTDINKKTIQIV